MIDNEGLYLAVLVTTFFLVVGAVLAGGVKDMFDDGYFLVGGALLIVYSIIAASSITGSWVNVLEQSGLKLDP